MEHAVYSSEVDSKYVIDSMNIASVYLVIIGMLFKCKVPTRNLLHEQYLIIIKLFTHIQTNNSIPGSRCTHVLSSIIHMYNSNIPSVSPDITRLSGPIHS